MSLPNPPFFEGKILVTADNKNINWEEYNGGSPNNYNVDCDEGEYYVSELLAHLQTKMNAAAGTVVWTWELSRETGYVSVSGTGDLFQLNLTGAESNKLLTGGDVDSNGDAFYSGQSMPYGLGWPVDASYPGFSDGLIAPMPCGHCWAPSEPMTQNNLEDYRISSETVRSLDGTVTGETWSQWLVERDKFEYPGGKLAGWVLGFEFLTTADRENYIRHFWGPYASGCGVSEGLFRFYEKWSDAEAAEYVLSDESRLSPGFRERPPDFPHWPLTLELWRQ